MKRLLLKVSLLFLLLTVVVNAQVLTPANNATGVSILPTYTWTASTPNYTIQVYSDASYTSLVYQATGLTSETYTPSTELAYNTQYWWKVTDSAVTPVEVTGTFTTKDFLVSPLSTITGVPLQPRLDWTAITGATSYNVYISTSNTFPADSTTDTLTTATNYVIVPEVKILTASTIYYWKVEAVGATGVSSTWSFQTSAGVTITGNNPVSPVAYLSPYLSWYSTPSTGIRYRLQLVQQTTQPDTTQWVSGVNTLIANYQYGYTASSLVGGKTYWWRVIALKSYNGNYRVYGYSDAYSFTTAGGTSVVCTPSYPTDGLTVLYSPFTAYWYVDQYQTGLRYQINYSTSSTVDGDGMLSSSNTLYPTTANISTATTNLFVQFPTVSNGSTYYWQVRVYDPTTATYGNWSAVASFYMQGPGTLLQPILAYPTDGIVIYTTSPYLSWYLDQGYSGLTFRVYYRKLGAGSWTGPLSATYTSYNLSGLDAGTDYEWYVTSYNGTGESTPSAIDTFSVAGGSSSYAVATNPLDDLTVYTNTPTVNWYLEGSSLGLTGYIVQYTAKQHNMDYRRFYADCKLCIYYLL